MFEKICLLKTIIRPYINRCLDYRGEAAGSQTQKGSEPKFSRPEGITEINAVTLFCAEQTGGI
jgi:hypothetical protein